MGFGFMYVFLDIIIDIIIIKKKFYEKWSFVFFLFF